MGTDDPNVEAGIMGAGSGKPPATMRAVVLDARVPGVEAVGVVAECPGGEFSTGQQVATLMGGMGRVFDGGYADYTCVPAAQVIPFRSDLDWATLGAVPEMLQDFLDAVAAGTAAVPIGRVYRFDQIVEAHTDMEQNRAGGKLVVTI
jgi:NADPH:quinone reductase-like Zn-dependent oxidoreductase